MTKEHKSTSRAIKNLIQNAAKGSIESSFQLFRNYSEGKNVEQKDDDLANKYFAKVEEALINNRLSLTSLELSDFRRFRTLNMNFDEKVTVIIGDNGAGKTSIAEAIARVFSWFNNNLEKTDVNGRPITSSEIHVNALEYSDITTTFQFNKQNTFDATIGKVVSGSVSGSTTDVTAIKLFTNMYKYAAKNKSIMIPFLAFYPVERSDFTLKESFSDKASDDISRNRFANINTALEGSGKLENFSELYIELFNLAEGEDTKEILELKSDISSLEGTIHDVYSGKEPHSDDLYLARLNSLKEKLTSLLQSGVSQKYQRHLSFVNFAIDKLVPEVKNLEVDRSTGKSRLLVENFGNRVNISQLSKGQKMLVALTGDIAIRLVKLNPDAFQPLHSHGTVIIDEIELHLHPRWQQEILIGLQDTFPNIQFIVTTHSPQILSTVDNTCIRQLCLNDKGQPAIIIPTFQTKGVTSADILARIMGTNSVPEKLKEANWLNDFSKHLKENNREALDSIFSKIKEHFGEHHPVVVDCESQIRITEMKARLRKEQ